MFWCVRDADAKLIELNAGWDTIMLDLHLLFNDDIRQPIRWDFWFGSVRFGYHGDHGLILGLFFSGILKYAKWEVGLFENSRIEDTFHATHHPKIKDRQHQGYQRMEFDVLAASHNLKTPNEPFGAQDNAGQKNPRPHKKRCDLWRVTKLIFNHIP